MATPFPDILVDDNVPLCLLKQERQKVNIVLFATKLRDPVD